LYSFTKLLGISMDELFGDPASNEHPTASNAESLPAGPSDGDLGVKSRSDFGTPRDAWPTADGDRRFSLTIPRDRPRLLMDTGVVWSQLASTADASFDFIEILYPAGSSSTLDGHLLRHEGYEYGYLIEGELDITFGFDTYVVRAGESVGLDSSMPHLLTNRGTVPARGIWAVHHCANS
jgi:mannose-6-phosphate isomerase-like protein (cupin superfamily)